MSKCRYFPVSCHITVDKKYNIAVAGTGYVGLSLATLLAQHNHVTAVDIIPEKVDMINNKKSPIQDDYIEKYLAEKDLDLTATTDGEAAYKDADFVIIAAPTNYDSKKNFFDCSAVESVIELVLKVNPDATMIIKSTIPGWLYITTTLPLATADIACQKTPNSCLPTSRTYRRI